MSTVATLNEQELGVLHTVLEGTAEVCADNGDQDEVRRLQAVVDATSEGDMRSIDAALAARLVDMIVTTFDDEHEGYKSLLDKLRARARMTALRYPGSRI